MCSMPSILTFLLGLMQVPTVDESLYCEDYAPGRVAEELCEVDMGLAIWSREFLFASEACPRACGTCCEAHCIRRAVGVQACVDACTASNLQDGADPFTSYLHYLQESSGIPAALEMRPFDLWTNLTLKGADTSVDEVHPDLRSFKVRTLKRCVFLARRDLGCGCCRVDADCLCLVSLFETESDRGD